MFCFIPNSNTHKYLNFIVLFEFYNFVFFYFTILLLAFFTCLLLCGLQISFLDDHDINYHCSLYLFSSISHSNCSCILVLKQFKLSSNVV